ncbi:hypothetical protein [Limnohabitans sp. WS1]|uniref:hypothetical protein n=1 Tax=Limnohabitans sp. WS1 TaxID=1100726 RepID=UPI0011B23FA9|nr:hypothetical protein [Limnohabitans sp. WS1]
MSGAYPVQDFADGRVFVISAGDSRNPLVCADDHFGVQQAADGPTFVVVGQAVTDQRLQQSLPDLRRYGVTLEQLQQARDQVQA